MKKRQIPATPNTYTSPLQTTAQNISAEQRDRGTQTLGTATGSLNRFAPDEMGNSPYYRALLNKKTSATAAAGENALARSRERAQAAGFGGLNPLTYGAETALGNQQAARISQLPGEALAESIQPELQAAGMLADIGGQQQGLGQSYFGEATDLESDRLREFYQQQEEARKRKAGIWGSLGKIALRAASAIPGVPNLG